MIRSEKAVKVMESAIFIFGEKGFDNTSTQEIVKHAGISNATLFKHFNTKENLIRECYLATKRNLVSVIKEGIDPEDSFAGLTRTIWLNVYEWALQFPNKYHFVQNVSRSRFRDPEIEAMVNAEMMFYRVAFKAAKDKGEVLAIPFELVEGAIVTMLDLAVSYKVSESEISEKQVYEMFYRGVLAPLKQ